MSNVKESFARFLNEPTREGFRKLMVENIGEQDNLDFKATWCDYSKMAKHILAIANSGGGCIIIGVKENADGTWNLDGIDKIEDKATISNSIKKYVPQKLKYNVQDFFFEESEYGKLKGNKYQVIIVPSETEYLPFMSLQEGVGIKKNAIYCRRGTSSEEATYEELQEILNRRIETGYSTASEIQLEEHLAQLKVLYGNIDKYYYPNSPFNLNITGRLFGEPVENPDYPKEDYVHFIKKAIERKKKRIERVLDL